MTSVIAGALLIVSALAVTISAGTREITQHAEALHLADESLRVATAARAQAGFVQHLAAVREEFGSDVGEPLALSTSQAREAARYVLDGVTDYEQTLGREAPLLRTRGRAFAGAVVEVVSAAEAGAVPIETADAMDAAYRSFFDAMESARDAQRGEVAAVDARMARLGDIIRFPLALLIPLAVIVVYRAIVRRQQRQAELEVQLDAEKQVGRARDDFVAKASHELRTPLTSIYGLSQIIEGDPDVPETTRELAAMISLEAADLSRMVEDLLTTAKLEAGALTFELEQVTAHEEVEDVVQPFVRAGVDIEVDVRPAVVRVDRLCQRQILRNLISNARKYGGPHLRVTGRKEGSWYVWDVADDGEGVPPELEARLFQRFAHQGTKVVVPGGVGLGLSIVRALAEGMGGTVSYRRDEDGTHFEVRVPLAVAVIRAVAPASGGSGGGAYDIAASRAFTEWDLRGG